MFTDSYLKILVVFVLMMNTLTTPKRLEHITWLIILCVGYVAARGVFDYARGVNLVEGGRLAGAVSGIFGNPNDLATEHGDVPAGGGDRRDVAARIRRWRAASSPRHRRC